MRQALALLPVPWCFHYGLGCQAHTVVTKPEDERAAVTLPIDIEEKVDKSPKAACWHLNESRSNEPAITACLRHSLDSAGHAGPHLGLHVRFHADARIIRRFWHGSQLPTVARTAVLRGNPALHVSMLLQIGGEGEDNRSLRKRQGWVHHTWPVLSGCMQKFSPNIEVAFSEHCFDNLLRELQQLRADIDSQHGCRHRSPQRNRTKTADPELIIISMAMSRRPWHCGPFFMNLKA